jgi:hypothetical protein
MPFPLHEPSIIGSIDNRIISLADWDQPAVNAIDLEWRGLFYDGPLMMP